MLPFLCYYEQIELFYILRRGGGVLWAIRLYPIKAITDPVDRIVMTDQFLKESSRNRVVAKIS